MVELEVIILSFIEPTDSISWSVIHCVCQDWDTTAWNRRIISPEDLDKSIQTEDTLRLSKFVSHPSFVKLPLTQTRYLWENLLKKCSFPLAKIFFLTRPSTDIPWLVLGLTNFQDHELEPLERFFKQLWASFPHPCPRIQRSIADAKGMFYKAWVFTSPYIQPIPRTVCRIRKGLPTEDLEVAILAFEKVEDSRQDMLCHSFIKLINLRDSSHKKIDKFSNDLINEIVQHFKQRIISSPPHLISLGDWFVILEVERWIASSFYGDEYQRRWLFEDEGYF